ncbi:MAG TPA: Tat pathway signal sequence domain protein [Caulobacteraceae bacterium]|jgi:hypothetical protein
MLMRRLLAPALVLAVGAAITAPAAAQYGRSSPSEQRQQEEAAKKKKAEDWSNLQLRLPGNNAAGPCPYVKVLYDAARYQEFAGGRESASTVGYTGEIQGVRSRCAYKEGEPIQVSLATTFALGKGPQAQGDGKTYRYWVAVTRRNSSVLAKQWFDLPVSFGGDERATITDEIEQITIPRANKDVSGANFEILVGFEVTPEMAAFNREGKRFRLDAGSTGAASQP